MLAIHNVTNSLPLPGKSCACLINRHCHLPDSTELTSYPVLPPPYSHAAANGGHNVLLEIECAGLEKSQVLRQGKC